MTGRSAEAADTEVVVRVPTPAAMMALGEAIAAHLRPGDVILLAGELGAGKTTLTRGIGSGLGVRGAVTSPTFVLARVHPSLGSGPALVHVDAYRLSDVADLDDLDLDASLEESVTVVEWGFGKAEQLAGERLEIVLERGAGEEAGDERCVRLVPRGERWAGVEWAHLSQLPGP